MEELILRAILVGKELHVVDHQHVDAAVVLAEGIEPATLHGVDELVGELLAAQVGNPLAHVTTQDGVTDRLQ